MSCLSIFCIVLFLLINFLQYHLSHCYTDLNRLCMFWISVGNSRNVFHDIQLFGKFTPIEQQRFFSQKSCNIVNNTCILSEA